MTGDAQKQANRNQDAARKGRRFQLWLEIDDDKRVRRLMKKEKLPSKIAAVRFLPGRYSSYPKMGIARLLARVSA